MPSIEQTQNEGVNSRGLKSVVGVYDFAADGGAVGTIGLVGGLVIPAGATIVGGFVDVVTALASGGAATIACQVEAANDVVTAVGVASWTTGRKNILPAMASGALTASTTVRTTTARDISLVVAAAALTAGKVKVVLFFTDPLAG